MAVRIGVIGTGMIGETPARQRGRIEAIALAKCPTFHG